MKADRLKRVNELLRREIAELVFRLASKSGLDSSAVTVNQVITSSNLRNARVLISIRDHESERPHILNVLQRNHAKIQSEMSRNVILKYTPRLTFELDTSLEEGDRVLALISEMEAADPAMADQPAEASNPDEGVDTQK
ncbi:MAG: 30S ribosome-binding factor RbfA [Kiritimatiellae bacterium]|nr:30S ribosome-binding factor RbfA [Kiritimatiellia bacterium]